jgi:hypothetical protein
LKEILNICLVLSIGLASTASMALPTPEQSAYSLFYKLSDAAIIRRALQEDFKAQPDLVSKYKNLNEFLSTVNVNDDIENLKFAEGINSIKQLQKEALQIIKDHEQLTWVLRANTVSGYSIPIFWALEIGARATNHRGISELNHWLVMSSMITFVSTFLSGPISDIELFRPRRKRDLFAYLDQPFWNALLKLDAEGKLSLPEGQSTVNDPAIMMALIESVSSSEIEFVKDEKEARAKIKMTIGVRECQWSLTHLI